MQEPIQNILIKSKKALAIKSVGNIIKNEGCYGSATKQELILEELGNITKKKKTPGGAKTNENGLPYEKLTDLSTHFVSSRKQDNFDYIKFSEQGQEFINVNKSSLHKFMDAKVEKNTDIIPAAGCKSPDEAFINIETKKLVISEKKFQETPGSVDEKLQTGVFKKFHYSELFPNYKVYYVYCLSDWFKKPEYSSVIKYLKNNDIPVFWGNDENYKKDMIEFITNNSL